MQHQGRKQTPLQELRPRRAHACHPLGHFTEASRYGGEHSGFAYKTGAQGLGYYADGTAETDTGTCTLGVTDLTRWPVRTDFPTAAASPKQRARRARNAQGKRLKPNKRLKNMLAAIYVPVFAATSHLTKGWWKEHGLWAVDTTNPNCFDACETNVFMHSCADVVLTQDTRLRTDDAIGSAKRRARDAGWNSHFSIARTTDADRGSGGCGVLARKGTGVTPASSAVVIWSSSPVSLSPGSTRSYLEACSSSQCTCRTLRC